MADELEAGRALAGGCAGLAGRRWRRHRHDHTGQPHVRREDGEVGTEERGHRSGCDRVDRQREVEPATPSSRSTVKVPKIQPGKTMTLTVHHDAAKSAGGYAHVLDGNQDPGAAGESGVAPNGDDYVWHLSSAPSTKFKMVYTGTYEYTSTRRPAAAAVPTRPARTPGPRPRSSTSAPPARTTRRTTRPPRSTPAGAPRSTATTTHVSCTIQTPGGYQWVTKRTNAKYKDTTPISFIGRSSHRRRPAPRAPPRDGTHERLHVRR